MAAARVDLGVKIKYPITQSRALRGGGGIQAQVKSFIIVVVVILIIIVVIITVESACGYTQYDRIYSDLLVWSLNSIPSIEGFCYIEAHRE